MNYRRWFLFFILCCTVAFRSAAQNDSCHFQISLLTCGPGEDLYSIWGHTAIRVIDSTFRTDIVYNYGTFDDSDPYFYFKFTKGIMRYSLSVETFDEFMQEYTYEHRSVIEQVLQLNCEEKKRLLTALQVNAQEKNRYYNYHFYNDNCTLRAKDIIKANTNSQVIFGNILQDKHPTYRQLIHYNLNMSGQLWSKFGIDILLGHHLDQKPSNERAMFLPDYLMDGFDHALTGNHTLISSKHSILAGAPQQNKSSWFTPAFLFWFLLIAITLISFIKSPWAKNTVAIFDFIFFLFIGLLGALMLYLWLARVDAVCRDNINILWALPSHIVIAFFVRSRRGKVKIYFFITAMINIILLLGWKWWPQGLNTAVIPLCITLVYRSLSIFLK